MDTITLTYIDSSSGVVYSRTINALRVKGFDPVDDLLDFPNLVHKIVDGSLLHQTIGFRRKFTIELGVITTLDRLFVGKYYSSTSKYLAFTHNGISETVAVVRDLPTLNTRWKDDTALARYVVLELLDKKALSTFPINVNLAVPEIDMYIKKRVLITGTNDAPESFSTGSGKLATCDAPSGAYPYFDDTLQKYAIDVSRVYQDCHFSVPSIESTTGGVLTFTVARSDAGNPESGVSYYADITIKAVNII